MAALTTPTTTETILRISADMSTLEGLTIVTNLTSFMIIRNLKTPGIIITLQQIQQTHTILTTTASPASLTMFFLGRWSWTPNF
jgi:hypothetical protein